MTADDRDPETLAVRVPDGLPVLTPETSRILLAILIELTEVEVLDGPPSEGIT